MVSLECRWKPKTQQNLHFHIPGIAEVIKGGEKVTCTPSPKAFVMSDSSVSVQLFRRKFSQVTWVALHFPYPLSSRCGPSSLESLISSQARDKFQSSIFFLDGKGRFLCSFSWVLSSVTTSLLLPLISGIEVIRTSSAINKAKILPPGYHSLNININFLWKF